MKTGQHFHNHSHICLVNGNWGIWLPYSPCSVTCGRGTRSRMRECDSPAPSNGGAACVGEAIETSPCDSGACVGSYIFLQNLNLTNGIWNN